MADITGRSPGVLFTETSEEAYKQPRVSNATAIVGTAKKGPLSLTLLTSISQTKKLYGEPHANNSAIKAVMANLATNGECWFQRVVSNSAEKAVTFGHTTLVTENALKILNEELTVEVTLNQHPIVEKSLIISVGDVKVTDNGSGGVYNIEEAITGTVDYETGNITLKLTKPYNSKAISATYKVKSGETGAPWIVFATQEMTELYNGYKVSISETGEKKVQYTLSDISGKTVETYSCSTVPEEATFIVSLLNRFSSYITATVAEDYTEDDVVEGTWTLEGGNSGMDVTADDIVGEGSSGMKALYDAEQVDFATLVVPGWSDRKVWEEAERLIEYRKDIVFIPSIPFGLTPSQVIDLVRGFGEYVETGKRFDNSAIFLAWPNAYINNPNTGKRDYVDIAPYIAATFAKSDNNNGKYFAPAGVIRGKIDGVDGLEYNLTKEERDRMYNTEINLNSVVNVKNHGICLMGSHTAKVFDVITNNTALRYINVRRTANYIRKVVLQDSLYNLFDQNDPYTWNDWKLRIDPKIREIKEGRGLYDYQIIMDETTVTQADIDEGRMPGIIRAAFMKPGEYIDISFTIAKDGTTSFSEVISNSI